MVGTTYAPKPYDEGKTEKLGITLHLSRLQKIDKMRGDVLPKKTLEAKY